MIDFYGATCPILLYMKWRQSLLEMVHLFSWKLSVIRGRSLSPTASVASAKGPTNSHSTWHGTTPLEVGPGDADGSGWVDLGSGTRTLLLLFWGGLDPYDSCPESALLVIFLFSFFAVPLFSTNQGRTNILIYIYMHTHTYIYIYMFCWGPIFPA